MAKAATSASLSAGSSSERLAPSGARIGRPGGPGNLFPGAGKLSVKTDKLVFCGEIVGFVHGMHQHPNNKDNTKTSTRFLGRFILKPAPEAGQAQRECLECYLPGVVERALISQISRSIEPNIPIAVEVWAEPDAIGGRETATGYQYAVYNRMAARADDPLWALAAETGIGDIPALAAPRAAPALSHEHVDPETGEVTTSAA